MRRTGYLFDKIISFENLYAAFVRAFSGTGRTAEACRFHFHLERELLQLQEELTAGTYQPGRYHYFTIYDPKERTISVAPFRDRVVHHALVGVLEDIVEPRFIHDSYANRLGKGAHRAVKRAQVFLRQNQYYLKADVAKYFDGIDHEILLNLLGRIVKDKKVLDLTARLAANSDQSRGLSEGKGLPIGNLTSQFFANLYLDPLDHYLKDELRVQYYLRYMDDFVLFSDSRTWLKERLSDLRRFLETRLKLSLKPKAVLINTRLHGLSFLGYRIFPRLIRIRRENLKRMIRRMRRRMYDFRSGRSGEAELAASLRGTIEHLSFADSLNLRRSLIEKRAGAY
ncbi:MAG: reverse transcriptase/maturase family protein [Thermodesulfobacteriota bacterium]